MFQDAIVACGGRDTPSSNGLRKAFMIKTDPIRVEHLPDMKSGRANHCLIYFDRYVYVIGGCDHDNRYTNRVERLNLSNFMWEDTASCNEIRDSTSGVGVERENALYVFGGRIGNASICRTIEKYIIASNIWISIHLKIGYDSMVLGSIMISPTKILIFGGQTGLAQPLKNCNIIDLEQNTVKELSDMNSIGGCVVNEPILFNNKVYSYVFQGSTSRSIEFWDIATETWGVL